MSNKREKAHRPESKIEQPDNSAAMKGEESLEGTTSEVALEQKLFLEELQKDLDALRVQAAEYKDGWQRAVADFQNYKRRTDAERADNYQHAVGTVIKHYLPILDDMERALLVRPPNLPWSEGIEHIYRKLKDILEKEGIRAIDAEGKPFDPNFHEAIAQEEVENVESGIIIGVIQQGYILGERVLRPAVVRVAK